jgi:hypothetical protein
MIRLMPKGLRYLNCKYGIINDTCTVDYHNERKILIHDNGRTDCNRSYVRMCKSPHLLDVL